MAENYSFFNSKDHDRKYNSRHWADYFYPLFKTGVFNGDLQVVENEGMTIKIKPGYAWIDGYAYHLTDGLVLDLETASGNMNRQDSVVIRLDLTNRWVKAFCKTGSYYAGTPMPPAPEISPTIHEIVIAHILVIAGTTEVTQDMIEDTRIDGNLCGWVCGAVEQIDFTQIQAQFDTFFAKYKADILRDYGLYLQNIGSLETQAQTRYDSMDEAFTAYENAQKAKFEAWVESIKEILDGSVAGNLLLMIYEKMQKVTVKGKDGVAYLEIEDGLNLAIAGFTACDTVISPDKKTIIQTDGMGNVKSTKFLSKTYIEETYAFISGETYVKTTRFDKNNITERIVKNE